MVKIGSKIDGKTFGNSGAIAHLIRKQVLVLERRITEKSVENRGTALIRHLANVYHQVCIASGRSSHGPRDSGPKHVARALRPRHPPPGDHLKPPVPRIL